MAPLHDNDHVNPKSSSAFNIHQEEANAYDSASDQSSVDSVGPASTNLPMITSKLANQQAPPISRAATFKKLNPPINVDGTNIGLLMGRKSHHPFATSVSEEAQSQPVDARVKKPSLVPASVGGILASSASTHSPAAKPNEEVPVNDENANVADLKKELEEAKKEIAGLSQQLSQQQVTQQTMDQVLSTPAPTNVRPEEDPDILMSRLNVRGRPNMMVDEPPVHDAETMGLESTNNTWGNASNVMFGKAGNSSMAWDAGAITAWNGATGQQPAPHPSWDLRGGNLPPQMSRAGSGASMNSGPYRGWGTSYPPSLPSSSSFSPPVTPFEYPQAPNAGSWQPRPGAVPFNPAAVDFSHPWNNYSGQLAQASQQQYMPPVEPMNYRRLLDRNVSCNWKYIVDKIICSNDQQASIFLQQKLKVSSAELKYELIESIIAQGYPLMINRFGNFLVQRCLEHGTPDQVNAIANTIRGKTLELSMDAFGCHVVQKAFDVVPETYKASMVHELLRQIPQTVVHRYACHVWQKLFELRWSDSPPQIMKYVNEALRGMWHEVALGETGSLVVQNIFENCLDEDKRPCITEVLANIDLVAHGQFGNWCIQHICEHGAPADKSCATEQVLRYATEYSTDQFASKVVEKCLKVAGGDFLERYLEKVCEARPDRPRMPLIDIAGDQYGNYLIQFILLNADHAHREIVAQNIRKHMVSLRGSKFGSRVAMLCNNPAMSTRPGPPMPFADRVYQQYAHPMNRAPLPGPCR